MTRAQLSLKEELVDQGQITEDLKCSPKELCRQQKSMIVKKKKKNADNSQIGNVQDQLGATAVIQRKSRSGCTWGMEMDNRNRSEIHFRG